MDCQNSLYRFQLAQLYPLYWSSYRIRISHARQLFGTGTGFRRSLLCIASAGRPAPERRISVAFHREAAKHNQVGFSQDLLMNYALSRLLTSPRAEDSNSSQVSLPIGPQAGLTFQTNWGHYDLPRHGIDFAADLIGSIYKIWLQPNNEPVVRIVEERMVPFFFWESRFTPRFLPRTPQLLTP